MSSFLLLSAVRAARHPGPGVVVLAALLGLAGCAHPVTIELKAPPPPPTTLTPPAARLTDQARQADLNLLERLEQSINRLAPASGPRAEAAVLLTGVRTEYLSGSGHPWLDQTVQRLVDGRFDAPDAAEGARRGWADWIGHVRRTRGFRAALPLLEQAEQGSGVLPSAAGDARPADQPERLWALQVRLAALHDHRSVSVHRYAWAKAQAWLDYALDEHFIRDRSGIVAAAAGQAEKIIAALETPESAGREADVQAAATANPALGAAAQVASDYQSVLWLAARRAPAASSAALAKLEVALRQAAHEQGQRGSRAARPYVQAATRLAAALPPVLP